MKISIRYIYSLILLVILIFSFVTNFYRPLVLALSIVIVVMIVDKMGRGIVFRESTAFLYVFTCLLMPLVGYIYFNTTNQLARLWVKYMPVPESIYFEYALPAISCFCLAITWPLKLQESPDEGLTLSKSLLRIREILSSHKYIGVIIIATGIVLNIVAKFLPGGIQFFATLFFFATFAGFLYVYYTPDLRYKKLIISLFVIYILANSLASGMFTIVAYMGITIFSLFIISKKRSFVKNLSILVLAVGFILVLQSTKGAYRKYIWKSNYTDNKAVLFFNLFVESASQGKLLLEQGAFFNTYVRTNQGYNVGLVMRRIPVYQPYDGGENLMLVMASAFVPRFLWPNKPEAGGKFNMKYYAGYTIRNWSTNVGPLGEAYGSFGRNGGILFMLLLGFLIRWSYLIVFRIGKKNPLLICWIPLLFYQVTYSAETDTLQVMNSLVKSAFFVWLMYKVLPSWFAIAKKEIVKTAMPVRHAV